MSEVPTSVYRYYDKNGVLIYVGITKQRTGRNSQHNADKVWWPLVFEQKVEHLPSRLCAQNRERDLIRLYKPPFNKVHNPEHAVLRAAYEALSASVDAVKLATPKMHLIGRKHRMALRIVDDREFYTTPEDAPLVPCLTLAPGYNTPILSNNGRHIGCLTAIERGSIIARLHVKFNPGVQMSCKTAMAKLHVNTATMRGETIIHMKAINVDWAYTRSL